MLAVVPAPIKPSDSDSDATSALPAPGSSAEFEQCLLRLEAIVAEMETPELSLERSLALFEEGTRLAQQCRERLDAAEGRVEQVLRSAQGWEKRPFSPDNGGKD